MVMAVVVAMKMVVVVIIATKMIVTMAVNVMINGGREDEGSDRDNDVEIGCEDDGDGGSSGFSDEGNGGNNYDGGNGGKNNDDWGRDNDCNSRNDGLVDDGGRCDNDGGDGGGKDGGEDDDDSSEEYDGSGSDATPIKDGDGGGSHEGGRDGGDEQREEERMTSTHLVTYRAISSQHLREIDVTDIFMPI
uniref:Uncharacterized protein DDB_G0290685-like n=1 Tax=Phascolarctos cinereus TaxID=38626 RepID=A0A6P5LEC5_PHACI|nr:uncharacterized protein DDB_G0290685-like [Phascolarctos cinereus]